jgi:hypothetical protein
MSHKYSVSEQLDYLNQYIFNRLWTAGKGLIGDMAVHYVTKSLPDVVLPVSDSQVMLDKLPSIVQSSGKIILQVPGNKGNHQLRFFLNLDLVVSADFNFNLELHTDTEPTKSYNVNTNVDLPFYWELICIGLGVVTIGKAGVVAALIPTIIEEIIEEVINKKVGGSGSDLDKNLASLSTLTYNHTSPYTSNNLPLKCFCPIDNNLGTNLAKDSLDGIDIVIVADNFSSDSYLCCWDDIPGNDNQILIDFLRKRYDVNWVENAKIQKIDDGMIINLSFNNNFLALKLNDEKTKINLEIDDSRTDEFIARTENSKLNIYSDSNSDFVSKTDKIADVFFDTSRMDNARFRAIKSIIRFWRLPIFGQTQSELIVKDTVSGSSRISSFGNLARLAETGLRINSALAANPEYSSQTKPIIVILKRMSGSPPRAIALGDVVLLPIKDSDDGKNAGSILIHELGHVIGGLADEYVIKNEIYMGPEPSAINVSKIFSFLWFSPKLWHPKWADWIGKLPAASQDAEYKVSGLNIGAYEFGSGIYRPAIRCKMRESAKDTAFCPVCEETLAMGLYARFGLNSPNLRPSLTLEIEYKFPWVSDPQRYTVLAPINGASNQILLPAANIAPKNYGKENTTDITLKVLRSAIPDAIVKVQILPGLAIQKENITVEKDSIVQIEVKPDSNSPIPAGLKSWLRQSVTLVFNQEPDLQLSAPTSLFQQPGVGSVIHRVIDPNTGTLMLDLTLGASSGGGINLHQKTKTVFAIQHKNGTITECSLPNVTGVKKSHTVSPLGLEIGKYSWSAVSRIRGTDIESEHAALNDDNGLHFEIREVVAGSYNELPRPLDAKIIIEPPGQQTYTASNIPGQQAITYTASNYTQDNIEKLLRIGESIGGPIGEPLINPVKSADFIEKLPRIGEGEMTELAKYTIKEDQVQSTWKELCVMHSNMPRTNDKFIPDNLSIRKIANSPLPLSETRGKKMRVSEIDNRMNNNLQTSSSQKHQEKSEYKQQACHATAYHPEGKPMRFELEFCMRNENFTESDMIYTEYKTPTSPNFSYLVEAYVKIPSRLAYTNLSLRVRTIDKSGRKSPWLVINDPQTRLPGFGLRKYRHCP